MSSKYIKIAQNIFKNLHPLPKLSRGYGAYANEHKAIKIALNMFKKTTPSYAGCEEKTHYFYLVFAQWSYYSTTGKWMSTYQKLYKKIIDTENGSVDLKRRKDHDIDWN